jgi:hypothetical protein
MLSTGSIGDSNFKRVVVLLAVFITGLGIFSMYGGDMNIFVEHVMQNFLQIDGFAQPNALLSTLPKSTNGFETMSPGSNTRSDPR